MGERLVVSTAKRCFGLYSFLGALVLLLYLASLAPNAWADNGAKGAGQKIFASQCAGCHGRKGRGDGPASTFLYPRPRNFLEQQFKLGGSQEDVHSTIKRGIPGTSMPSFATVLDDTEIDTVARFVRSLAGETAVGLAGESTVTVPDPVGSVEHGREVYRQGCTNCHGAEGRGDGPSARLLVDDAGVLIRPPNYARAAFKGGTDPASLFKRVSFGMPGTPMPGYGEVYSEKDRWDLVAYLRSLIQVQTPPPTTALVIGRVAQVPRDASATAWSSARPLTVPLNPLWQRVDWPSALTIRALHDGDSLSFKLTWKDDTEDRTIGRVQDFVDAVAVMFPQKASVIPFIGMGQGDAIARIIDWRAVEQRQGPEFAYPREFRDASPWNDAPFTLPAVVAGNPLSGSAQANHGGVMELISAGPGTVTPVPPSHAFSHGRGVWADGSWTVQLTRSMEVSRGDVSLPPGTKTHAAFAVWDGSAGDRNGQKSISQWIPMEVEP